MGDRIAILREGGVLAQYDTPDARSSPTRPTTSSRSSSAPTARSSASRSRRSPTSSWRPRRHAAERRQRAAAASVRDALSLLLADGGRPLTRASTTTVRRRARRQPRRVGGAAHARAGERARWTRTGRDGAGGRDGAAGRRPGAPMTATEPVIPNYAAHSSSCVIHNHTVLLRLGPRNWSLGAVAGAAPARAADAGGGGDRLRDLDGAGAGRPPLPAAGAPDDPGQRRFLYTIPSLALFELLGGARWGRTCSRPRSRSSPTRC